jgi:hypothetical protein
MSLKTSTSEPNPRVDKLLGDRQLMDGCPNLCDVAFGKLLRSYFVQEVATGDIGCRLQTKYHMTVMRRACSHAMVSRFGS